MPAYSASYAFVLAGLLYAAAGSSGRASSGSDCQMRDLFVSVAPLETNRHS